MNPRSQDTYTQAYNKWVLDPSPDNMAELVSAFMPTINSELQQYSGSKELMRTRAKSYVIQAIRSYDPLGKTKLNSWVVTNLKQLSRYGKRLRPIHTSEDLARNAAELNRVALDLEDRLGRKPTDDELQDETGWSVKTIDKIRKASVSTAAESNVTAQDEETGPEDPSVARLDTLPFRQEATYMSLDQRDKDIFDYRTGSHGKEQITGDELAKKLGITPAYVSQRASAIGSTIKDMEI